MKSNDLITRDLKYIWHPCSQMKDYELFKPLIIKKAQGSWIELSNGEKIFDAISSWWCKSLGHGHPRLKKVLHEQIEEFEHVIFANTTYEVIVELSEKLSKLMPTLTKVFYAGDGSCAIEIAMKMSLHARTILGEPKNKFIALKNAYHGETVGALSVSDVGLYKDAYDPMLFNPFFIDSIPYVTGSLDVLWNDCTAVWNQLEPALERNKKNVTALIVEPIVQGSAGMKIYSRDFLSQLREWTRQNNIHLIADEIMTGMGRTGKMFACEHANVVPDFMCLGKGLTSGWIPFSAVLTHPEIYDCFYDHYSSGKNFLHSHTYSGNPLGARIALETLKIIEENSLVQRAVDLQEIMLTLMEEVAFETKQLMNVRGIGAIVAADLKERSEFPRWGYAVYQEAVKRGVLLRPLANTIYWLPPLNVELEDLKILRDVTIEAIHATVKP